MKTNGYLVAAAMAAVYVCSCSPFEPASHFGKGGAGSGRDHTKETGGSAPEDSSGGQPAMPPDTVVYLSGVEFPEGYDWVRDTAYGAVRCSLVLLRNGERILEIPAGYAEEASVDPDMHRIVGGHLYTDFSTETETIVKRDGAELFRYPGAEAMRGFLVKGGAVHTLGQSRSGKGFSYRIDGQEVLSKSSGEILGDLNDSAYEGGALYEDEGHLYFSWKDGQQYRIVCDGTSSSIAMPGYVTQVFDIRMVEGILYRTVLASHIKHGPLILIEDTLHDPTKGFASTWTPRICRIVPRKGEILVKGNYAKGILVQYALWNGHALETLWETSTLIHDVYEHEGEIASVASAQSNGEIILQYRHKISRAVVSGKHRILSNACAALYGGKFYVALTGMKGDENILWVNGETSPVKLRGFLTGVKVAVESQSSQ